MTAILDVSKAAPGHTPIIGYIVLPPNILVFTGLLIRCFTTTIHVTSGRATAIISSTILSSKLRPRSILIKYPGSVYIGNPQPSI
jgi:hypothetical protein